MGKKKTEAPETVEAAEPVVKKLSGTKAINAKKAEKKSKVSEALDALLSDTGEDTIEAAVDPAQVTLDQVIDEVKEAKVPAKKSASKKTAKKSEEPAQVEEESDFMSAIMSDDQPEPAPAPEPKKAPAKKAASKKSAKPVAPVDVDPEEVSAIDAIFGGQITPDPVTPEVYNPEPEAQEKEELKAAPTAKKKVKEVAAVEPKAIPEPEPFVETYLLPDGYENRYSGIAVPEDFLHKKMLVFDFLKQYYTVLNLNEVIRVALNREKPLHNFQEMIRGKRTLPDMYVHAIYMFLAEKFGLGQAISSISASTAIDPIPTSSEAEFERPPYGILFYQAQDGLVHAKGANGMDYINSPDHEDDGEIILNDPKVRYEADAEILASYKNAALHVAHILEIQNV